MKIYTKVVWHWQPDGSLEKVLDECESFDYEGPVSLCGNSTDAMNFLNPGANYLQGKNKMPQQPDYIGAANAQSMGSIGASLVNNQMSHPNINTPLGSQTWNQTGNSSINIPGIGNVDVPQYEQNIKLAPEQQKLYDQQTSLSGNLYGQAGQNLSRPQDLNSVQDINNKAYGAMTSRLDPQWTQNEAMQKTQLANQGLAPGGEAYDNSMRVFNQGKNDAYQQANLAAIQTMPQTQNMAMQLRDQPLNELNALKTGTQVNMPQFQPSQYSMGAQGPNSMQAAQGMAGWQQAMYNQQMQQQNSTNQGLMGLGAAGMMMFA